jgi:hypothetical protein
VPAGRNRLSGVVPECPLNRRREDGAKTIEAFTGRLREELDLDTLTVELLVVVINQTIEPTKTSLWLRPSAEGHGASVAEHPVLRPLPCESQVQRFVAQVNRSAA